MGMINIRVIVYGFCRQVVIKVNYKSGKHDSGYMSETLYGLIIIGIIYDMT
jgi:hypothetical protein